MTDRILFDITSFIFAMCWIFMIYYGIKIGKNIEDLYEAQGSLQEVFWVDKLKEKLWQKNKRGIFYGSNS